MAFIDAAVLAAAGFTDEIAPRNASVVVSVAGVEGTGKTSWSLTAPKPLLYQGTDFGTDGVIQRFASAGQIIRPRGPDGKPREYRVNIPHEYRAFVDRAETDKERQVREGKLAEFVHTHFYQPFYDDYKKGIEAGVRTAVWDTALEVWEYIRLSVYGRAATNRDDLKTEANAKMKELIRLANLHNVNLIMVNRLKPKWEMYYVGDTPKWRQTTEQEMQGYDKAPELVAINLWTKMTPAPVGTEDRTPTFEFVIKKCRDNVEFVGSTLPALPFEELMAMLIPGVEKW